MATACTYCGQDLPRDDARFCNGCGMLVPSRPYNSHSLSTSTPGSPQMGREHQKPILREQVAHQPQSRPRSTRRIAPDALAASSIAWPAPITHVSMKEPVSQKDGEPLVSAESMVQEEQHRVQNIPSRSLTSERELRVKIWEQEHNNPPTPLPESKSDAPSCSIKHTPTATWITSASAKMENVHPTTPIELDEWRNEVEHADTVLTTNYTQMPPLAPQLLTHTPFAMPGNTPLPIDEQQRHTNTPSTYSEVAQQPTAKPQVFPLKPSHQANAPVQAKRIRDTAPPTSRVVQRSKSRVPFVLLLAFLCILILGGGIWVVLAQPFSVPSITQPLQDFKDTHLSIDLSYPSSWSVQQNATGVLFSDSSHTAQIKLVITSASGDAAQYVQQQAIKSGMTALQPPGTRSFAGATWQQVQGSMQQKGVNYTTTMLATVHGNRTYVLMQMAPQNVYADEESVVFSAVRGSFKFL